MTADHFKKTEEIVKKALEKLEPDLAGSYFSLKNTEMEERLKKTLIDNEFVFDEQDFKDLCPSSTRSTSNSLNPFSQTC